MDGKSLSWALVLIVVTCSLVSISHAATKVSYCESEDSYPVLVQSVDINPDPVVSGKPATFSISATAKDAIPAGKLKIEVYYYGMRVHTESHNICTKTSCPINKGSFVLTNSQSLPGFTPPGAYKLKMKMLDVEDNQLTCININFSIIRGSLIAKN
eukprot:Gb_36544 [translate_table: standard]